MFIGCFWCGILHDILIKVQQFLEGTTNGKSKISDELIEEFGELCKRSLRKRFDPPREEYTVRMSNIGRPLCQNIAERDGIVAEPMQYADVMKFFLGDLIESAAIVIMKGAGVDIEAQHKKVKLELPNGTIDGELDLSIRGDGVYDIKSASAYSFKHTFTKLCGNAGSEDFSIGGTEDTFGYLYQGVGYAHADAKRFRGWIAIDKSSGEWGVFTLPQDAYEAIKPKCLAEMDRRLLEIQDKNTAFYPCFEPEKETFYKKETGNTVLGTTCSWCKYKWTCWPTMKMLPSLVSKADNRPIRYYVSIGDLYKEQPNG